MAEGKKRTLEDLERDVAARNRKKKPAASTTTRKPAEAPAKPQTAQPSDSKKKVLNQNNAGNPKPNPLPQVGDPSRRTGATPVTVDRREEREEKRFNRARAEWDRQHRIQRLEELDRDWRRQQT